MTLITTRVLTWRRPARSCTGRRVPLMLFPSLPLPEMQLRTACSGSNPTIREAGHISATMALAIPVPESFLAIAKGPRHAALFYVLGAPRGRTPAGRKHHPTLFDPGGRASFGGQLQDVHARIGSIDDINVAAVVGLDVVALDRRGAAFPAVDLEAA